MTATTLPATDGASGRDNATPPGAGRWSLAGPCRPGAGPPTRLGLGAVPRAMPHKHACAADTTTSAQLTQPMVSHHLQIPHRAALVTRTKHASHVYHQINSYALETIATDLTSPQRLAGPSRQLSACGTAAILVTRGDRRRAAL